MAKAARGTCGVRNGDMFKNLSTSTKLIILCGMFILSIGVTTHSLVAEHRIAIDFARRELTASNPHPADHSPSLVTGVASQRPMVGHLLPQAGEGEMLEAALEHRRVN